MTGIDLLSSLEPLSELRSVVVHQCPFVLLEHMQRLISLRFAAHQKLRRVIHEQVYLLDVAATEHERDKARLKKVRPTLDCLAAFDERYRYPRAELMRITEQGLHAPRQLPEHVASLLCDLEINAAVESVQAGGP